MSEYRSMYGLDNRGKRRTDVGGGPHQSKRSRGVGKRIPDMPSPPKPNKK